MTHFGGIGSAQKSLIFLNFLVCGLPSWSRPSIGPSWRPHSRTTHGEHQKNVRSRVIAVIWVIGPPDEAGRTPKRHRSPIDLCFFMFFHESKNIFSGLPDRVPTGVVAVAPDVLIQFGAAGAAFPKNRKQETSKRGPKRMVLHV